MWLRVTWPLFTSLETPQSSLDFQPNAERSRRQTLDLRSEEEFEEWALQLTLPLADMMIFGIFFGAQRSRWREGSPGVLSMALKLNEVKAESSRGRVGDEMFRDQIERFIASCKHTHACINRHIRTHTLGFKYTWSHFSACVWVHVCLCLSCIFFSKLGEWRKKPRGPGRGQRAASWVPTGGLIYKCCLVPEAWLGPAAPLDLHRPWCLRTWLVLCGVLFHSIWGIYLVSWWKESSNTEDVQWTFFFAYPWDPQLRKDSQNWKHHHNCVELHNFYTAFASIVSSANIFTHWKSTMIKHLTMY